MADKENLSQDTPVEEVTEITAENNETIKEFLGDQPKEEPKEPPKEPEKPVEEKPKDKPAEEPVKEEPTKEPEKPEEPEIPLEEVVEEVKTKTREEIKAEVLKSLGITKEEKKEVEKEGFKFAWEERGEDRPASWMEQASETNRLGEFQRAKQDEELKEKEKKDLADVQARQQTINAEWDTQLDYLRQEELLPKIDPKVAQKLKEGKILTPEERADVGLKAQAGIFETMYEVARERETQGLPPVSDIVHIFNRYYKPKQERADAGLQAGKKAPVSGGGVPVSGKEEEVPYDELHAKDFEELLKT